MHYELIATLSIAVCLIIISLEYLWLYRLAQRQENEKSKYDAVRQKVASMVEGIFYSPTFSARKREIESLAKIMNKDTKIFEMIFGQLCFWEEYGDEESLGDKSAVVQQIYDVIKPIELFGEILKSGNKHTVGYACRRLADFDAYDYLPDIQKYAKNKNRNVSYNAAMALSRFGDMEGLAEYLVRIQNDKKYSGRIINEFFSCFSGDRAALAMKVFETCNEYMKLTVIKAVSPYGLEELEQIFKEGVSNKNINMRIACVKALSSLGKEENEQLLLIAAKDKNWVVRSSAVKGLQYIRTPASVEGVKEALKDKEWWVRQAAAEALFELDVSTKDVEEILGGYDKYAADAVKYTLYRNMNLKGKEDK